MGKLDREAADTARRAGDEHALLEEQAAQPKCPQGGQPGDRQRRGLREADLVRERGQPVRRHRRALGPRALREPAHDPRARGRPGAVPRRVEDDAGEVPARPPALSLPRQAGRLAAVERDRVHLDERLGALWLGVGHLAQLDEGLVPGGDERTHRASLRGRARRTALAPAPASANAACATSRRLLRRR